MASPVAGLGFAFDEAASKRHADLLSKIGVLQAEADTLRQREVADAIAWMRAAIQKHGLTKQDLGFR